jgi:hypothetical protein
MGVILIFGISRFCPRMAKRGEFVDLFLLGTFWLTQTLPY